MRTRATLDGGRARDQGTRSRSASRTAVSAASNLAGPREGSGPEAAGADRRETITVVLGHFSSLFGIGLTSALRGDRTLCVLDADVADAELEGVLARHRPLVAMLDEQSVVDVSVPLRLRSALPRIALVVLARRPTRDYALHMLGVGVSACLCKDTPATEILSAVRFVAGGRHLFASLSRGPSRSVENRGLRSLTARESEVLRLVGLGQGYNEIGRSLHIEAETARSHVKHICRKLGVSKRHELIRPLN
jgi:DNA-binding NarL/FixJ family response regulator